MKLRIYVDTSVIGGCYDEEFSTWSNRFFEEVRQGLKIVIISDLTYAELDGAPANVKRVLNSLSAQCIEGVSLTQEAENLAQSYVQEQVVSLQQIADAQHIAIATIAKADLLVSWNFKQIVNLKQIHSFNAVNLKLGYPILEIRSPREVVGEEEV